MMHEEIRSDIARFMRRLYRHGLTTTSGGNISCRLPDGNVAITASQLDKGELQADGVGIVSLDGTSLTPELKLSIETSMHLEIYARRPDVQAIVHAHPVTASLFCALRLRLDTHLTAEAYALLGDPVFIPYALMGSRELAQKVAEYMAEAQCGLMENHGALTLGKSLLAAFDKLELLENAAKHTFMAAQLGNAVSPLTAAQLAELDCFMGR